MAVETLLVSAAVALLAGLVYAYVAWRLRHRRTSDAGTRFALGCFTVWWGALAANLLLASPLYAAAAFGLVSLPMQLLASVLQRVLLAVSLVGLMAYFLFLLTGRARVRTLALIYAAYVVMLMSSLTYERPIGVDVHAWRTDLDYTNPAPVWTQLVSFVIIIVPPVLASLAYLRLLPRATTRTQRYRIWAVSCAILVWWVVAVVAGQAPFLDHAGVQVAGRVLGASVALVVMSAFTPPAWMQRRFGLEPVAARA